MRWILLALWMVSAAAFAYTMVVLGGTTVHRDYTRDSDGRDFRVPGG